MVGLAARVGGVPRDGDIAARLEDHEFLVTQCCARDPNEKQMFAR